MNSDHKLSYLKKKKIIIVVSPMYVLKDSVFTCLTTLQMCLNQFRGKLPMLILFHLFL